MPDNGNVYDVIVAIWNAAFVYLIEIKKYTRTMERNQSKTVKEFFHVDTLQNLIL